MQRRREKVCEIEAHGLSSRLAALLCARSKPGFDKRKRRFDQQIIAALSNQGMTKKLCQASKL
jgi:hypothetical protein